MGQQAQRLEYPEITEHRFLGPCTFVAQRFRALEKDTDVLQVESASGNELRDRNPAGCAANQDPISRDVASVI